MNGKILLQLMLLSAVRLASLSVGAVNAQTSDWQPMFEWNTARLAEEGHRLIGTSGMSWPDGRQSVVTFWEVEIDGIPPTVRCITSFAADQQQTGDLCKYPKSN